MKRFLLLAACGFQLAVASSQNYSTSADIYLGLKKLNVLGSVLYMAAHPDDENTRLMIYFSKDKLYRTGYLSLTRGDGGQNLIGDEQGVELGLIRTQELLSARRIDGAEQFFSRAFDFGYSKTPEETFTKWDREKILSDAVWVIRKFQPDVIITRFPTTGEGGHGHHTASAILANEAYTAAADPNRFPEQLKYVKPWQVKRVLWNGFNFNNAPAPADAFKMDVGGYNPVLGKSYGEIAAESRSQHKSQGFGATKSRGEAFEYFRLTSGSPITNDLFDDVNTSWSRVNGGSKIEQLVNNLIGGFDFMQPQKSVPQLVQLYKALNELPQGYWKDQKLKETKELIEAASGLWVEAFTSQQYAVQGDSIRINFVLNDRMGAGVKLYRINFESFDSTINLNVEKNRNFLFAKTIPVATTKEITQPYWLKNKMAEGYFNVTDQQLIGQADVEPAFYFKYDIVLQGEHISFVKPLRYKFTDQVKGELYEPVVILPKYTVEIPRQVSIVRSASDWREELSYVAQRNLGTTKLYRDQSIVVNDSLPLAKGGRRMYNDKVDVSGPASTNEVSFRYFEEPGKITAKELHTIKYDHIPYINYFTDAVSKYVVLDVKTAGRKIGYIVGAGDKVPESLEQMGYEVTLMTEKELARNNLAQFDAIISGVRAFNTNEWMNKYYDKLMKYVEQGGNYIVQYSQANNVRGKMGPYNFILTGKRITDENAAVTFLKPDHQVLNFPNKITQEDFKGWIQERSIYHAGNLDEHYETILRMNDPNESPDDGSLVIAKYGKGYFTYTGLVFFRELPAGVPGAYRLMANIIALNRKKEF
ncbi:MAG: PIG-L family deacetylase [Flavisolibacter sp.]